MSLLAAYLGSVSVSKGPGLEGVGMEVRSKDLDLGTAQKGKDQVEYVDHDAQEEQRAPNASSACIAVAWPRA